MINLYNKYLASKKINISQLSKDIFDKRRQININANGIYAPKKNGTLDIDLFSDKSCTVFVSLAENFACVTKATNNVEEILGYSQEKLYGKNIKLIIPQFIAEIHDEILLNFVKKSSTL